MPYIKPENRDEINPSIDQLGVQLKTAVDNDHLCGELNYSLFRIIKWLSDPSMGGQQRYARYNTIVGALECCKLEAYRRLIAPYEDLKIKENGDV